MEWNGDGGVTSEAPVSQGLTGASPLDLGDVAGLRAFGAVDDLELDRLAFLERAEAVALNGGVVHEDVTASVALDESRTPWRC